VYNACGRSAKRSTPEANDLDGGLLLTGAPVAGNQAMVQRPTTALWKQFLFGVIPWVPEAVGCRQPASSGSEIQTNPRNHAFSESWVVRAPRAVDAARQAAWSAPEWSDDQAQERAVAATFDPDRHGRPARRALLERNSGSQKLKTVP
jgi:hypothetical protein